MLEFGVMKAGTCSYIRRILYLKVYTHADTYTYPDIHTSGIISIIRAMIMTSSLCIYCQYQHYWLDDGEAKT